MKKLTLYIILSFIVSVCYSQSISVSSFKKLDSDLTANTAGTIEIDQNGETAALIKVVTTQTGFTFDGGAMGIVKTLQKPSEIWVYVPKGLKKISISHPQLGILRDYYFPLAILSARTYELVLATGTLQTIVTPDIGGQYLVLKVDPHTATAFIDENEVSLNEGSVSKFLSYGIHSYRISDPLHLTEAGQFNIGEEKTILNISLKPAYGILEISTSPQNGAKVYIDNDIEPAGVTPFKTRKLSAGNHTLKVHLKDFETKSYNHVIQSDGSVQPLMIRLEPIFSEVSINIPKGSMLFVDGQSKGSENWNGHLAEGMHVIEVKKPSHLPSTKTINVIKGQMFEINMDDPMPIYGSININSTPVEAKIIIDGKNVGITPDIVKNILIGNHTIIVEKDGYISKKRNLDVKEGQITNFTAVLEKKKEASTKDMDERQDVLTFKVGEVQFCMKRVEGGSFNMGATPEQSNCLEHEKPVHKVNISTFYIGETEVTQELWETVMGNNPSRFKGELNPVEEVSWHNCKTFINKLNNITGQKFRLPTEAEWEYAARGGNKSKGYLYSGSNVIDEIAWYKNNSNHTTREVKSKKPNELGLYDMSGNVWEWCSDWMEKYASTIKNNPQGPSTGTHKSQRGGSWFTNSNDCRNAYRDFLEPGYHYSTVGLRLAL